MKSFLGSSSTFGVLSNAVSLCAVLLIVILLSNRQISILSNPKISFFVLWILGLSMSLLAGFRDYPDGKFVMPKLPLNILMILGFLAFILLIIMLMSLKIKNISSILSFNKAFFILSIIIIVKLLITRFTNVFFK